MGLGPRRRIAARILAAACPFLALFAEVLLFYRKPLFTAGYLIPYDLASYNLPLLTYVSQCLRRGELPLWDPYTYCGFPFFANIQAQLWYPPAWLTVLGSGFATGRALLDAMEWNLAAHVFIAGCGAYLLLRRLGAGRCAATLGGTVFQLGSFFASVSALGASGSGAWLPYCWLAVVALRGRFGWRWLALLAFAFAMSALGGFPAVTAVVFGSTLLLALLLSPRRLAIPVLGAAAWAGALAAIQLLPTLQLIPLSISPRRAQFFGSGGGSPLISLVTLILPNRYGELDMTGKFPANPAFIYLYCGIPGLVLAALAPVVRRGRGVAAFAAVTLASLVWMLGTSTPVAPVLYRALPMAVRSVLYLEFTKVAFVLGLAVLAGVGMDALPVLRRRYLGVALVVLAAGDLISVASGRRLNTGVFADNPIVTPEEFEGAADTLTGLRELANRSNPPWRVEAVEDSRNWAASAAETGIYTPHGNEPLVLSRMMDLRRRFCKGDPWERYCEAFDLKSPVLDFLSVRYYVSYSPAGDPPDPEAVRRAGLRLVRELPGHRVYENPRALPRFYLVRRTVKSAEHFDPSTTAVVEDLPPMNGGPRPPEPVRVLDYGIRRVVLETESAAPTYLVTSETYYPGWTARVDGREERIHLSNGVFRGLPVPAGRHTVVMKFAPVALLYGAGLSSLAWCALAVTLLWRPKPTSGAKNVAVEEIRHDNWMSARWRQWRGRGRGKSD